MYGSNNGGGGYLLYTVSGGKNPALINDRCTAPVSVLAVRPQLHRSRPRIRPIPRLEATHDARRRLVVEALTTGAGLGGGGGDRR